MNPKQQIIQQSLIYCNLLTFGSDLFVSLRI